MGQGQSKSSSAQRQKKQKRSEAVEAPVEGRGSDPERRSAVMQEEAQMEQKVVALENRTLELEEAAQAISAEKANCEQKLASMSGMIDKLVLEKAEEKAQMEQKVVALENRTLELEEAAQAISAEKANCEQRLAAMLETIDKQGLERTEKQKAECELKLAAMLETIDKRVLEITEIQKAESEMKLSAMSERVDKLVQEKAEEEAQMKQKVVALENRTLELEEAAQAISAEKANCEQKLASMSGMIDKLVLEKAEEKANCEQRLAAMLETIDKQVLERTEKQKAECELKLAAMLETIDKRVLEITEIQKAESEVKLSAMSERVDKLVQEKADMQKNTGLDHRMVTLERLIIRLEQATQEKADSELTEAIEKRILERTEMQKAACEVELAAMSQRIHELVQEKTDEKAQMELKVVTLQNRTLELEEAAQAISAEKADCEQKLASMSGMIDKLVLEKAEAKAEYELRLAALHETIDRRVLEITEIQKADYEQKLTGISQIIDVLALEKTEIEMEAMAELDAGFTAEPTDSSIKATAEEEAQMEQKVVALQNRTPELVEAAQAISAEKADCEQKLASMSGTIDKLVREKAEAKAEYELRLAALHELIDRGVLEITEEKAKCEQNLAAMLEKIDKQVLERTEKQKAECEMKLAGMLETIDKRLLEIMEMDMEAMTELVAGNTAEPTDSSIKATAEEETQMEQKVVALQNRTPELVEAAQAISAENADCEQTLASMSGVIDKLLLEKAEAKAEYEQRLPALYELIDRRVLEITEQKAKCEQSLAAMLEKIDEQVLERTEKQKAECELKLAAVLETIDKRLLEITEEETQMEQKVVALQNRTPELVEAAQAISAEKADCEQKLASMSGVIDKLVREKAEAKAEYELRLAALHETIDRRVLEITEEKVKCEQNLAAMLDTTVEQVLERTEKQKAECDLKLAVVLETIDKRLQELTEIEMEAMAELDAGFTVEPTDSSIKATAEESMDFREKSAAKHDTIDLPLLTTTQELVTATSTEPINMAPRAPGSCDSSGVQSNSSEQLKSRQAHQDGALTEEGAHEVPCSSCIQEEERLPPPEQSPTPEPPAVEEEMKTDHSQYLSETSDELSLGPEPRAVLEESFLLLSSDERWMKVKGLHLINLLAEHQPETLFPDRQEICRAVLREVMSPWYLVSIAALGSLAVLLSSLKTYFDPFLDWIAGVLFLKAASDDETLQQLTNAALDHMIRSCSPVICMKEILFFMSGSCLEDPDQEAVARECFAVHLLALVESGRYEPEMHELFPSVRHLTQDTSEVVRSCAEKVLAVLSKHVEVSQ